ncbi:MAG TPA: hypothetical protein VGC13_20560 [Longimicrobium sp.]|uniref:hypothetical protein n=1 Tax=Longimicrobium sp. TaxID=2029185 RepID=UPI002ED89D00
MRMMLVLAAVAALAAPLAGQDADGPRALELAETPTWFTPRSPAATDPRLAVAAPASPSAADYAVEARPRLSFVSMMMIGSAVGCVAGAVIMSSGDDVDEREKAPVRFNGCLVGAPAGMLLGAVVGWASGARMP